MLASFYLLTRLLVANQVTIILSFTLGKVEQVHIFFGVTIIMIAAPQIVLVGDLWKIEKNRRAQGKCRAAGQIQRMITTM